MMTPQKNEEVYLTNNNNKHEDNKNTTQRAAEDAQHKNTNSVKNDSHQAGMLAKNDNQIDFLLIITNLDAELTTGFLGMV